MKDTQNNNREEEFKNPRVREQLIAHGGSQWSFSQSDLVLPVGSNNGCQSIEPKKYVENIKRKNRDQIRSEINKNCVYCLLKLGRGFT